MSENDLLKTYNPLFTKNKLVYYNFKYGTIGTLGTYGELMNNTEQLTMPEALDCLSILTLENTFTTFSKIPEHIQDMYIHEYVNIFSNYYITEMVRAHLSDDNSLFTHIKFDNFSTKCTSFIETLLKSNYIGKYSSSLKDLVNIVKIHDDKINGLDKTSTNLSAQFSNSKKRFWKKFVTNTKSPYIKNTTTEVTDFIYQAEVPF